MMPEEVWQLFNAWKILRIGSRFVFASLASAFAKCASYQALVNVATDICATQDDQFNRPDCRLGPFKNASTGATPAVDSDGDEIPPLEPYYSSDED